MLASKPVITLLILGISVVVAIASGFGQRMETLQPLLYSFYITPRFVEISQGQLWRLVSPVLVHFGPAHLAMNGVMFWVFGRLIEPIHGAKMFTILILITAAISNTAQYLVSGPLFGGLSGVLYALVGFVWALGKLSPSYPLKLDPKFTWFILGWFILCWSGLLSLVGIHVANTAHTAGLAAGLVLAFILVKLPRTG